MLITICQNIKYSYAKIQKISVPQSNNKNFLLTSHQIHTINSNQRFSKQCPCLQDASRRDGQDLVFSQNIIKDSLLFSTICCTFASRNKNAQGNMKKLAYIVAAMIAATTSIPTATSCKFAPDQNDGDTVAASVFYPEDTTTIRAKKAKTDSTQKTIVDSVGLYYVGSESTKEMIQLVSYPSRRDTLLYSKTRHVKVKGCADINGKFSIEVHDSEVAQAL